MVRIAGSPFPKSAMLPTDTDFYGIVDQPYRGTRLSDAALGTELLPLAPADGAPTVEIIAGGTPEDLARTGKTAQRLAREWERCGVVCHVYTAANPRARSASVRARSLERIVLERIAPRDEMSPGRRSRCFEHPESYALNVADGTASLTAATHAGLERGAATLALSLWPGDDGSPRVAARCGADRPAVDIRFLGGWALWRGDQLREAIDLAWAFKANRVLYNGWGWIPGEALWKEDAYFVDYARERGIELVYELRRMSFGEGYDIREPAARRRIVEAYEKAAGSGFRSFGLLFDDVPWETAADECALAAEIYRGLQERSGEDVEFFCCPQFYWYPGQMNAAWSGLAGAEETAKQREYLKTYGRSLPEAIQVYVANFWGGHPSDYQHRLRQEFSDLIGRKPIFFDNQQINDYRLGALFPFPLTGRPEDFGDHVRGYYLNCARPLSVYAPAAATALAYAWNPADYEPESEMQRALQWFYGPSRERVRLVGEGLNRLCVLANAWAGGTTTAVDHYRTIWPQAQCGAIDLKTVERWAEETREVRRWWLKALELADTRARPGSGNGLLQLIAGTHRLEGDLELFGEYLSAARDASLVPRFTRESARLGQAALDHVAALLPPAPGTVPLLVRLDDETLPALDARDAQGWSWVEYFYRRTLMALRELRGEMLAKLSGC